MLFSPPWMSRITLQVEGRDHVTSSDSPQGHTPPPVEPADRLSIGELVSQMSEQVVRLVRAEINLAKTELAIRAQNAGLGIAILVVAGVLSLYALGWLLNSAALGLANVVAPWLAALIVAVVLLALVVTLALVGKRSLSLGLPPTPERAAENVKLDVEAVKEGFRS
jgi:hypothetical protein